MSIEVATYIADLQPVNPPATDPRGQGDDHLRLIKQVLQNTFPSASKPAYFANAAAKSTNYTVLRTDGETTLFVGTGGGAVTLTLPGLAAADIGWKFAFQKTTNDANPIFVVPPSGTLNSGQYLGLTRARRCIPGSRITVVWDGTIFWVERALNVPIGTCMECHVTALPPGFEWPNGQILASAATNYPEYNQFYGNGQTYDKRGRVGVCLDNLGGSAAGRLPSGVIAGSTFAAVGGVDAMALAASQIPSITSNVSASGSWGGSTSSVCLTVTASSTGGGAFPFNPVQSQGAASVSVSGTVSGSATSNNTSGGAHTNLQPAIMISEILVVE
jgi:microcystin-dependent protein